MKKKNFSYNNYIGSIEFDIDDNVLHGQIMFIKDTVTYEAFNLEELKAEFKAAVDDYLETCQQLGREPQKTCSGTFNVRVGEQTHRDAVFYATKRGQKLNDFCKDALEEKIEAMKEGEKEQNPITIVSIQKAIPSQQEATAAPSMASTFWAESTDDLYNDSSENLPN